jgi:hypothetical protein
VTGEVDARRERLRRSGRLGGLTKLLRYGTDGLPEARQRFIANFATRHECRLCGVVTIDQTLPAAEREDRIDATIRAHFHRMGVAGARARRGDR